MKKEQKKSKQFDTLKNLRLSIYKSNKHIYIQLINDKTGHTILFCSTNNADYVNLNLNKVNSIFLIGVEFALKALKLDITSAILDIKGSYSGRVKSLCEGFKAIGFIF